MGAFLLLGHNFNEIGKVLVKYREKYKGFGINWLKNRNNWLKLAQK
jgi:hypothetical protein